MKIIKLGYAETANLARALAEAIEDDGTARTTLRVSIDDDQVKFKINQAMWSAPLGQRVDPE